MIGRGRREAERSRGLRWFAASAGLAVAGATVLAMGPAHADSTTTNAQLSLSGVVTASSPVGGSVIGIHPGDSVTFKASTAPTAGLDQLGLGSLVDGVLNTLARYQVTVDFHNLPGGAANTKLSGSSSKTFAFPTAGTYDFTWSAQNITVLGAVPINLDGNQLAAAGIKLNANNQYVGSVVVAADPPKGGISIQLPGVSVAPSVPVVGQLPTVGVPGINAPTIPVTIPTLPGLGGGKTTGTNPGQAGNPGGSTYTPPGLTIPQEVVPSGDGNGPGTVDNSGFGSALPNLGNGFGSVPSAVTSTAPDGAITTLDPANTQQKAKTVQLAANPSPSAQMPVLLAIIAIIALSLVTATYARLYLLRKPPTA